MAKIRVLGVLQNYSVHETVGKSRVSEVLNRNRKLTLEMIRNLTKGLNLFSALLKINSVIWQLLKKFRKMNSI